MYIQGSAYSQTVAYKNNANSSCKQNVESTNTAGDKVSISEEAKRMAQKMGASEQTDLPLEEYRLPEWYSEYHPPCTKLDPKIGQKTDMEKEMFIQRHDRELSEYNAMLQSAYREICDKYNISKFSDYAQYSDTKIENEFRQILSQNAGVENLMEELNVSKKL
ncbi:hypothetical protein [Maridesulfovibrio sp.]|uniref:hypothetical protein n=1 Tax=Maridesulfovibrio sp. TaxID=2795000 RepID=UPI0029F4A3D0|nr:hypothetical protein [Maridesulfovibrio sp.]